MNILIADDHKIVRMGLSVICKEEIPSAVIFEAENAAEVKTALQKRKFEVMLLDLNMTDVDSTELLKFAIQHYPTLKVLVISLYQEKFFALQCMMAGALGYIEKSKNRQELRKAILKVSTGETYINQEIADLMADQLKNGKSSDPFSVLTKQEFLVATHWINAWGNKEIAEEMHIQPASVNAYKREILEKMNLANISELMQVAKHTKNAILN